MSKKFIIIILLVISITLLITPFIFEKSINDKLSLGVNLISALSSILTLGIAVLLFNKFGIETTLLEKQTTEVFSLLHDLNRTNLMLSGKTIFMGLNPTKPYQKLYEEHYDKNVIFSSRYMIDLNYIWNYSENIFLPKEIADKIRNLKLEFLVSHDRVIEEHELRVFPQGLHVENETFGNPNNKPQNLMEFTNSWIDLMEEIKNWISKNSAIKTKLNLD